MGDETHGAAEREQMARVAEASRDARLRLEQDNQRLKLQNRQLRLVLTLLIPLAERSYWVGEEGEWIASAKNLLGV